MWSGVFERSAKMGLNVTSIVRLGNTIEKINKCRLDCHLFCSCKIFFYRKHHPPYAGITLFAQNANGSTPPNACYTRSPKTSTPTPT